MKRIFLIGMACSLVISACAAAHGPTPPSPAPTSAEAPARDAAGASVLLPPQAPPGGAEAEFRTDFQKSTVPFRDILSGGPPKDGIPSIDRPAFVSVAEASGWLTPVEPVIRVQVGEDVRAYPIQVLMWHEIVNDVVGGAPLAVTFCPLCNTAIAFERTVGGRVLDFGTTGRLRYSNLIMYDRQTETWWQQASGEAITGELAGARLVFYPAAIIAWADFKSSSPGGKVLSRDTGFKRNYGANPYIGYDDVNNPPLLYRGPATPGRLKPMARVLTVDLNGDAVAFPYDVLEGVRVVNDSVGGQPVVVIWQPGTASALDKGAVADGRDVGSAVAYSRRVDGAVLTFVAEGIRIHDLETGSEWSGSGRATAGKLTGKSLSPAVAVNHFWFSWAAFRPETRIYQP